MSLSHLHHAFVVLALVALSGCAAVGERAPQVTPAMASSTGISVRELQAGRRIYVGRCASCHSLYPVAKYDVSRWRQIVIDESARAKLSAPEENALIDYLIGARSTLPDRD